MQPPMQFLFIRPGLCLRLLSDSQSPTTPLPLANDSYCQVHSGLTPPSYRPCRAHCNNGRAIADPAFVVRCDLVCCVSPTHQNIKYIRPHFYEYVKVSIQITSALNNGTTATFRVNRSSFSEECRSGPAILLSYRYT